MAGWKIYECTKCGKSAIYFEEVKEDED